MKVKEIVLLILMSLTISACATDPYFHGGRPGMSTPSLSSAAYIWSRDTAQKIAYRPRGGAAVSGDGEIPLVTKKGVTRVDVKTFIQRLEPQ